MRPRLIAQLTGNAEHPLDWRCQDSTGSLIAAAETPPEAARGHRVMALVPGTDVLTTRVHLPVRNRQRLLRAVPWALEDRLSEDVDALHFAVGERGRDGGVPVAVVARRLLGHWKETLAEADLAAEQLYPDYLALPWHEGAWTVLVSDGLARVRTAAARGFACDAGNLALFLESALAEDDGEAPPNGWWSISAPTKTRSSRHSPFRWSTTAVRTPSH
ncbi:MAG: type II secretion system protein GspL [Arhodomonas sp.]|nr:type II secretion system protein GspL [Arhodomonas sp.]